MRSRLTFLWWLSCRGITGDDKNWTKIGMTLRAPNLPPLSIPLSYALLFKPLLSQLIRTQLCSCLGDSGIHQLRFLNLSGFLRYPTHNNLRVSDTELLCSCTDLKVARGSASLNRIPFNTFRYTCWFVNIDRAALPQLA